MNSGKISIEQIRPLMVSSIPTRPTSDHIYGGEGYSPEELKAAFDALPLYIIEVFNTLIDDIESEGDKSLAASIPTGISEKHTLYDLFMDIKNGNLASYVKIGGESLSTVIARLSERCGL